MDRAGLRDRIAVIMQDYNRWPMTALENITMGHPAAAGAARHAVITVTGTAWVMRRPRGTGPGAASAKSGRFTRSHRQIGGKH